MDYPYGEQYGQEGNPRAYMTMRDYRNLPYQWQQPLGRNPNPNRSMRDYRDQWMSAPVYSVPSTYPPPPHPQYSSWFQPQPPQPISPIEQAILDLTKLVGDAVVEQKEFNAQFSKKIHTEENSLDQRLDGLNIDFEHKWDNLQDSIEDLVDLQLCPPEEECQSGTMVEEQCEQQPHQELIEDSIELSEGLTESSDMCDVVFPRENQEEIISLLTEEAVEEHKENIFPLPPTDSVYIMPSPAPQSQPKTPTANAQATYYPLPVAPSDDLVYIQPQPAANSKPAAPAPKVKSNPLPAVPPDSVFILPMPAAQPKPQASTTKATPSLLVLQNIRRLVASVHTFATTSKKMANAYIAWHSGWFWCGFGFGASEPRHF